MNYQMTVAQLLDQTAKSLSATNKMTTFKLTKVSNSAPDSPAQFSFAAIGAVFAIGGAGNEFNIVQGDGGDNNLSGSSGFDIIIGDAGSDTVDYSYLNTGSEGVSVDLARRAAEVNEGDVDILSGIENVTGSKNDDELRGNSGANIFTAGGGNDVIDGRGGSDILVLAGRPEEWRLLSTDGVNITLQNGPDTVTFRNIEILRFVTPSEDGAVTEFAVGGTTSGGASLGDGTVIARDDNFSVAEEGSVTKSLGANDTVINTTGGLADALVTGVSANNGSFSASASNAFGTLTKNDDGTVTFAANGPASEALAQGQTDIAKFFYRVAGGDTAEVSFTVTGTNDGPTITSVVSTGDGNGVTEGVDAGARPLTDNVDVTFNDFDVRDTHTVEITGTSSVRNEAGAPSGTLGTATTGTNTVLDDATPNTLGTLSIVSGSLISTASDSTGSVSLVYTVDNANAAVQALGAGDTITETFSVRINDGQNASNSLSPLQIITFTITGTNDGPVVAAAATGNSFSATIAEDSGNPADTEVEVSGSFTVSDLDLGDTLSVIPGTPTVGEIGGVTLPADIATTLAGGLVLAPPASFVGGFGAQTVDWTFTLPAGAADFLPAGKSLTLTIPVTVADDSNQTGGSVIQNIIITINGTDDEPTIGGTSEGIVSEDAGDGPGGNQPAQVSGMLTVSDPDSGESGFQPLAEGAGAKTFGDFTFNAESGEWTYTLRNGASNVQALREGATRTDTLTVLTTDGSEQVLTVTITGDNDVPVISAVVGGSPTISEDAARATDTPVTVTGSFAVSDIDVGDTLTVAKGTASITGSNGLTVPADLAATLANGLTLTPPLTFTGGEAPPSGTVNWSFNLGAGAVDFLPAGASLTLTIPVNVTDDSGSTANNSAVQNIVITINGTNDAPHVSGDFSKTVTEDVPGFNADGSVAPTIATGKLTVTDVDQGEAFFVPQSVTQNSVTSPYGSFSIDAAGAWAFTLNNNSPLVQSLAQDQTEVQRFTVTTIDGATRTITITIQGQEDAPVITGGGVNLVTDNLVFNGSFETPEVNGSGSGFGTAVPTGWTAAGNFTRTEVHEEPGRARTPYGDQWLDTALSPGDTLVSQAVANVAAGTSYVLSVALSRGGEILTLGTLDNGVAIRWGNVTLDTIRLLDLPADNSFKTFSFLVRGGADGAANTISFQGVGNGVATLLFDNRNIGVAVDNVSLVLATNQNGTVTEDATTTLSETDSVSATGSFEVRDVDQGDDLEITEQFLGASGNGPDGAPLSGQLLADLRAAFSTTPETAGARNDIVTTGSNSIGGANGQGTATVTWTYNLPNSAVQYLAAGQTLTLNYVINVTDNVGGTVQQPVTITIVGSNDGVVVAAGSVTSKSYTELADTPESDATPVSLSGVINFTDVDVTDTHTPSVDGDQTLTFKAANGTTNLTLPDDINGDVITSLGSFSVGTVTESPTTAGGSFTWSYDATDGLFDFLGVGQTLTITQNISISDGKGSTISQPVSVVITGTNDRPTVQNANTGAVEALINGDSDEVLDESDLGGLNGLNLLDLINAQDVDTGDVVTVAGGNDAPELTGTVTINLAAQTEDDDVDNDLDGNDGDDGGTTTSFAFDISDLLELGAISVDADGNLSVAEGFTEVLGAVLEDGDSLVVDAKLTVTDAQGAEATADIDFMVIGNSNIPTI